MADSVAVAVADADADADVLVVGCGYAGAVAAIEAHDAGARVLVLEKMPDPGGISVCSAGGVRIAFEADAAFAYLQATNAGTTPDAVLRALADAMVSLPDYLKRLAARCGASIAIRRAPGNYPFPGHEALGFAMAEDIEAAYPQVEGSPAGARLFKLVEENLRARRIELRCGVAVHRLTDDGVLLESGGRVAAKAIVLACGGFEGSPEMQAQFWQGKPVLNAAFRGNTGDGIRMAQERGAALWHMWHYHGSYGFRHTDASYPFGIRTKRLPDWLPAEGQGPPDDVKMPWILVDGEGRRFMNEYEPYLQDTGHRPLDRFKPESQSYARLPAWLVADEAGRKLYPFGRPTYNERGVSFDWSADNLREVELGILRCASDVASLAEGMGVSRDRLSRTLDTWNAACTSGRDETHGRPPTSMMPLRTPPYYYAPVWPIVSNTQGGPVHDARQRILNAYGEPIPGLFAAGELGSVFGHLYLSGGNLAECFAGGAVAGREAAAFAERRA